MLTSKKDRLAEIIRRLDAAPAAASASDALQLIGNVMNAVEDDLSGVPNNPTTWETDGRMYPPTEEQRRDQDHLPGVARYRARAHATLVAENGAFRIEAVSSGVVLIDKAGADGRRVKS